jgi:membrane protease subunit HflK
MKRSQIGAVALVGAVLLGTLVPVDSGDVALVYRFGAIDRVLGPGLNLTLPWPIETTEQVGVSEIRRVEIGALRLLTGDTNLVDVDLVIQYTVSDPQAHQLTLQAPERALSTLIGSIASEVVASMGVDTLLTTGRSALQQRISAASQDALDNLGAGVRIAAIEVRNLSPPPTVVEAFNDVSSARGDRDTLALAGESYASKRLPQVRGEGVALVQGARASATERIARASAEVARFNALVETARRSPRATRLQLWKDTVIAIGKRVEVHAAAPGTEVHLNRATNASD